jgi:hypothetical protein
MIISIRKMCKLRTEPLKIRKNLQIKRVTSLKKMKKISMNGME